MRRKSSNKKIPIIICLVVLLGVVFLSFERDFVAQHVEKRIEIEKFEYL